MIVTEFYNGQGIGNQLWCYVVTRALAKDKGLDFGIKSPEKFKGLDFMSLNMGREVIGGSGPEGGPPDALPEGIEYYYNERRISHPETGADIRLYDRQLVDVPDNTKIDGVMQDEQYVLRHRDDIRQWLTVKPEFETTEYTSDDICVMNFRGGEYLSVPEVFLTKRYWQQAVDNMRQINPNFRFVVITDDPKTAKKFFPKFEVHDFGIAKDYVVIKNARYLILSNTSFAWFPAWLSTELKYCIAPKYWARHNVSDGYWSSGYNLTSGWMYQDRNGNLQDYDTCRKEQEAFVEQHRDWYTSKKIEKNFLVVSSYKNDLSWIPEKTNNYLIYDKNESDVYPPNIDRSKVVKVPNVGYNISDYCTYIIDHYEALPECVIFTKGNVFPRHVSEQLFDQVANNESFTPIEEARRHRTYRPVSFISADGGFNEINNSWYLRHFPVKYFSNFNDFLRFCYLDPVIPKHVRFAPGACYVVPRANIRRWPKGFYENLRTFVSHGPLVGEAHIAERALYTLWTADWAVNPAALQPGVVMTVTAKPVNNSLPRRLTRLVPNLFYAFLARLHR